jgi:hypothetical protein
MRFARPVDDLKDSFPLQQAGGEIASSAPESEPFQNRWFWNAQLSGFSEFRQNPVLLPESFAHLPLRRPSPWLPITAGLRLSPGLIIRALSD